MMLSLIKSFRRNQSGAVTVETSFLILILIILTGGTVEAGYAFYQWNGAQNAARTGARLAATYDPVSLDISNAASLSGNAQTGDPMPYYERHCSDETRRCSSGSYDSNAMQAIIYGPDGDGTCGATTDARRGICDVFRDAQFAKVDVSYVSSGLGRAGAQGDPAPLVTVRLREVPLNFAFMDLIGFSGITHLPPVEVTVMGEDLRNG